MAIGGWGQGAWSGMEWLREGGVVIGGRSLGTLKCGRGLFGAWSLLGGAYGGRVVRAGIGSGRGVVRGGRGLLE